MDLRFIDWIWHVQGSLALAPGVSADEAFDRIDPIFREPGTSRTRAGDRLTFRKKDQAAQDRMAIFDGGVLQVEPGGQGSVMRYRLTSRALLLCFLAPLMFLAFAQLTIFVGKMQEPTTTAEKQAAAAAKAKKKAAAEKVAARPMNPIDKALGAPALEKPKDDKDDDDGGSPTTAYVLAGIFAALYLIGRILEDRLVKSLFRKRLSGT